MFLQIKDLWNDEKEYIIELGSDSGIFCVISYIVFILVGLFILILSLPVTIPWHLLKMLNEYSKQWFNTDKEN